MSKTRKGGARRPGKPMGRLASILLATVASSALIFLPTALLLAAGMVPTLVAWIVDRDPDKTAPMTVGAINFVGCMPFVLDLWQGIHSVGAVIRLMAEPLVWLAMYGSAAVGWALYYSVPPIVAAWVALIARHRIARIEARQAELVEAWGDEVRGERAEDAGATALSEAA